MLKLSMLPFTRSSAISTTEHTNHQLHHHTAARVPGAGMGVQQTPRTSHPSRDGISVPCVTVGAFHATASDTDTLNADTT